MSFAWHWRTFHGKDANSHVYALVCCVHMHLYSVPMSEEGCRAPSPGGCDYMTHRTRAAPALTVSASWLRKSHVARLQAQPWQNRKGITAGSIPHWPLGPGAFGSTRRPVYPRFFNTEELEQKNSKVAIPFVLPDCLPGTQVFRGKDNERPGRQGMCLVARSMSILALPLPGCRSSGRFLIKAPRPHL